MEYLNGYAEQYKDWSDYFTTCIDCYVAHAAAHDRQATAHPQSAGDTRIIDHAIHAVWQTTLPLCDWTRARSQILSLSEQRRETSPPHLYTPGEGGAGSGAISSVPYLSYSPRGVVRDRLRVAHATRRSVASTHVVGQPLCRGVSRCDGCQSIGGQYVGTRRERGSLGRATTRGGTSCTRR
jgi:hypothetical protein